MGRALWAEATSSDLLSAMADDTPKEKKVKAPKIKEEKEEDEVKIEKTAKVGKEEDEVKEEPAENPTKRRRVSK